MFFRNYFRIHAGDGQTAGVAGLRAIIWLLGGVRGDSACCQAEEGPGMAAASCGGPYKRVNSVLLAVNILRLRRSARAVCSRCSPRLCLSATFSCYPFPSFSLSLSLSTIDTCMMRGSVYRTPSI